MVVAHGSSLRAIACIVTPGITEEQIMNFNIPNSTPIIFTLDDQLRAVGKEYVGDEQEIFRKMNKIKYETRREEV